jgi:outer membrane protein assembly factor BamB
MCRLSVAVLTACLLSGLMATTYAGDWPTYRGDLARSGSTSEKLPQSLQQQWVYDAPSRPQLAWSSAEGRVMEGQLIGHRVKFDDAFHPVVVGERAYFGSSVDHQLHCVELATGRSIWSFFTGGPVRLAPSVVDGRVYFGSDDGRVYCVDSESGELVWQVQAAPEEDWLLARGEMISRWPVRTGVLVTDGTAYFGAGIFPHENIYLFAVDAATGEIRWKLDNVSDQDAGRNELSPQGYLLTEGERLFVPSGRSLPVAFDRNSGELLHQRTLSWRTTGGGVVGGAAALLADGQIYASGPHHMVAMDQKDGRHGFGWFAGSEMVVQDDAAYVATGTMVARLERMEYAVNSRRRYDLEQTIYNLSRKQRSGGLKDDERKELSLAKDELRDIANVGIVWQKRSNDNDALLATDDRLFVGGNERVAAYDKQSGELVWEHEVKGITRGLAAANGHLLVSTDNGSIYAFSGSEPAQVAANKPEPTAYEDDEQKATYSEAAKRILEASGVKRGFALVVDAGDARLAYELARQSELKVYAVDSDAAKVKRAREVLSRAGVYGSRITVHHWEGPLPYSNYFANLIVSGADVDGSDWSTDPQLVARHLKPLGGVLIPPATLAEMSRDELAGRLNVQPAELAVASDNGATRVIRQELPGSGSWSHHYGNPANTAISDDTRIKGGLGVLWYGDPGPGDMVNRHDGAVGPLATDGRLFVQGETTIKAYDAYNGLHLWTYDNKDAVRTGVFQNQNPGNLAASDDRLFHFIGDICYELDAATGEVVREHRLPELKDKGKHQWGYVAVQDGRLFGTATIRGELASNLRRRGRVTDDATDAIFAIDLKTGEHLWTYQGQSISHHTIAVGPQAAYFIDSSITSEQRQEILRQDKSHLESLTGKEREIAEDRLKNADVRMATAIDLQTGEKLWSEAVDVTDCSDIGIGGGKLTLMYSDGVLILGGANANGHYWSQFLKGEFERRRLVALSAQDGYKLWARDANYKGRPIIIGHDVLTEPWSFDLRTGDQKMRPHPLTGQPEPWSIMRTGHHCGILTGCDSGMLMFRSGYTGFYDLNQDAGTRHFAGHRLGCWINAIPANGLVMIPEASAGCVCLFSIASTIVMEPREERRPWTIFSATGAQTPVKHMAINLGAPGDRKAEDGTIWLSYPRRTAYKETSLDVKLDLQAKGGGYRHAGEFVDIAGTDAPWLFTSWAQSLESLTLPLLGENDEPASYTVRLYFADARQEEHSPSKFDVKLNGQTVLSDVSVFVNDGTPTAVVETLSGISVNGDLVVELVQKQGTTVLNAIEAIREE